MLFCFFFFSLFSLDWLDSSSWFCALANQQGNPHYRMALKIMEHFCCMKKRIFILVMWRTCFVLVLALNHHSSLLSLLHIQHLQYFLYSSRGWGNVLSLCFSMFLIETMLSLNKDSVGSKLKWHPIIPQHPLQLVFFTWSREWWTIDHTSATQNPDEINASQGMRMLISHFSSR